MSNVLLGTIGVILFIGLSIAGAVFLGPKLMSRRIDAEATNFLNQQAQIEKAVGDYARQNGKLPVGGGMEPINLLVSQKYMTSAPPGGASGWTLAADGKSLITPVGGSVNDGLKVCAAARQRARMPNPENIYKCDGSNAPGGQLSKADPCCVM